MEISGRIYKIGETQQITEKFKKRDLMIEYQETDNSQIQTLQFQMVNNLVDLVNDLSQGDEVNITFSLRGKEYVRKDGTSTVFNNLDISKITARNPKKQNSTTAPTTTTKSEKKQSTTKKAEEDKVADDDLPF